MSTDPKPSGTEPVPGPGVPSDDAPSDSAPSDSAPSDRPRAHPAPDHPSPYEPADPSPQDTLYEPAAGDGAWGQFSPEPPAVMAGAEVQPALTAVRIRAAYRIVEVIADPAILEVEITGEHHSSREDGVLLIDSSDTPLSQGLPRRTGDTMADLRRGLDWAKSWRHQQLRVRVPAALPLELDVSGTTATVVGLRAPTRIRCTATTLKLERAQCRLDLDCLTSTVKAALVPLDASQVRSDSSTVRLMLGAGSDVTVTVRSRLSRVNLPDAAPVPARLDADPAEFRLGAGRNSLDVDAALSTVNLVDDSGDGLDRIR